MAYDLQRARLKKSVGMDLEADESEKATHLAESRVISAEKVRRASRQRAPKSAEITLLRRQEAHPVRVVRARYRWHARDPAMTTGATRARTRTTSASACGTAKTGRDTRTGNYLLRGCTPKQPVYERLQTLCPGVGPGWKPNGDACVGAATARALAPGGALSIQSFSISVTPFLGHGAH